MVGVVLIRFSDSVTGGARKLLFVVGYFLLAVSLCLIFLARRATHRVNRRLAGGLCPNCGYDLRASKDRCPECGCAIEKQTVKQVT
jgi:hypothetical protein